MQLADLQLLQNYKSHHASDSGCHACDCQSLAMPHGNCSSATAGGPLIAYPRSRDTLKPLIIPGVNPFPTSVISTATVHIFSTDHWVSVTVPKKCQKNVFFVCTHTILSKVLGRLPLHAHEI